MAGYTAYPYRGVLRSAYTIIDLTHLCRAKGAIDAASLIQNIIFFFRNFGGVKTPVAMASALRNFLEVRFHGIGP